MKEADKLGVKIKTGVDITEILKNKDNSFSLIANGGGSFNCDKLIVHGGNAKANAYEWLEKLGHTINKPVPSLFTFNIPNNPITELMGVAVPLPK